MLLLLLPWSKLLLLSLLLPLAELLRLWMPPWALPLLLLLPSLPLLLPVWMALGWLWMPPRVSLLPLLVLLLPLISSSAPSPLLLVTSLMASRRLWMPSLAPLLPPMKDHAIPRIATEDGSETSAGRGDPGRRATAPWPCSSSSHEERRPAGVLPGKGAGWSPSRDG